MNPDYTKKLLLFASGFITFGIISKLYQKITNFNFPNILKNISYIDNKLKEEKKQLEISLAKYIDDDPVTIIPEDGFINEKILDKFKHTQKKIKGNKNTGAYYIDNPSLDNLILQVYQHTIRTNPLHVSLCNDILRTEAEIVRMLANLYHGDKDVVGNVTTGGTDSIRHAVYTTRERARYYGMDNQWEIIIGTTAHPAFRKAANEYLIKVIECPVDDKFRIDVEYLKKKITNHTIMVVCSCPTFPHGVVDPIETVANILNEVDKDNKIGLHVDCCMGSFVVPYMKINGFPLYTRFDFDIDRVTSISIDTHKYGYADKGSSVILYKNHDDWRQHQIFVDSQWTGGVYATPTLSGSRSGKDIAATWATLVYVGNKKYRELAAGIVTLTRKMKNIINDIPELKILGDADVMIVAFASVDSSINIYGVKSEMDKKGWYLSSLQYPNGLHFCVTAVHESIDGFAEMFGKDLCESIKIVKSTPNLVSTEVSMYRSNQTFGIKEFVPQLTREYWNIINKTNKLDTIYN